MHLTRELTDASLQEIGAEFGGRSHGTVLHACNRVAEQIGSRHESAAAELTELRKRLGAPGRRPAQLTDWPVPLWTRTFPLLADESGPFDSRHPPYDF